MSMKHWIWFLTLIPMKNKPEYYKRFSDYTVTNIASTELGWMTFLDTMARNSKRSISELLLIHFQRPEASDCKSYQEWLNDGRRVKRGAIGIAVLDKEDPTQLRYLFNVTDTIGDSAPWRYSQKLEPDISKAIKHAFDVRDSNSFPALIEHAVSFLVEDYWHAHEEEILSGIMECWRGWDEYAAKLQFLDAAFYSASYVILERCGYHPQSMYELRDFGCAMSFYSPNAMTTLGEAIRSIGNQVLDVIERTIAENTAQRDNSIMAEGERPPSAFLKPKVNKKEMEVRSWIFRFG